MSVIEAAALLNPFPGLRPFREDEEHLFFGRESQVDRLVDKLAQTRFLAVVGTSGSGKSSLVNCGLKPALHRGLMAGAGTQWRMIQFRPGARPVHSMAQAFAAEPGFIANYQPDIMSTLAICEATLGMSSLGLADLFESANAEPGTNLLIVVDQFEELFRYSTQSPVAGESQADSDEAVAFVNLLLEAHNNSALPIYIVLTMRSDFLGECSRFHGLPELINEGQYLVPRMNRDERREAIAGPVGVAGCELSPVLLTRLVNDVGANPDQLSILQHAINRTWAHWQEKTGGTGEIALDHYEAVGTMAHALDLHAEEAYAQLESDADKTTCERIFKALTDKATDARGIRRPMPFSTLSAVTGVSPANLLPILDDLRQPSRSFLMPPVSEPLEPETVVDISHEVLMRVWERLKGWATDEAQSANAYRRVLAESAELYVQGKEALWRDPGLQSALEWQADEAPNEAWANLYCEGFGRAIAFLGDSKKVRDKERAEAEFDRRWRKIMPFLMALVFVLFLTISPRLSDSLSGVIPALRHFSASEDATAATVVSGAVAANQVKLTDTLSRAFGVWVAALLCMITYFLLTSIGKNIYRRMAFPAIARTAAAIEIKQSAAAEAASVGAPEYAKRALLQVATGNYLVFAGFWRRFIAWFVDYYLIWSLLSLVAIALLRLLVGHFLDPSALVIYMLPLTLILDWVYETGMVTSRWGGTLGDLVFRIAIVAPDGARPSLGRFSARFYSGLLNFLTLGLGALIQPFTARKQSLPDLIAHTFVVRRRDNPASKSKWVLIQIGAVVLAIVLGTAISLYSRGLSSTT